MEGRFSQCAQEGHFLYSPSSMLQARSSMSPLQTVDKYALIPEFLKARGLWKTHLDSFNFFVRRQIKKIVNANSLIEATKHPDVYLRYLDVRIGEPIKVRNGELVSLTPQECRLSDLTYDAPILVDIEYVTQTKNSKKIQRKKNYTIGRLPIMFRSCCCILHGKDDEELANDGECPLDPGGYFIVKGTEKVILIQERLSNNRIIIDADDKGCVQASVTSSSGTITSKSIIRMEKGRIYLFLNEFSEKVPIVVVLKAMGMVCDQEIVQMLGRDPQMSEQLLPSIEECMMNAVYTQSQALAFLDERAMAYSIINKKHKERPALNILRGVYLLHVPVPQDNFRPKCIYTAVMLRRMIEVILNKGTMDDKDYLGNKTLKVSGQIVAIIFEDLFKRMNDEARRYADKSLKKMGASGFDFSQHIFGQTITIGLAKSLSTGNGNIKRFGMDSKGMTEALTRQSYIETVGRMTKIYSQFDISKKVRGPRALQPSEWGMLCPCDTPVGEACGLVKNLALMTHVTTDEVGGNLKKLCYSFGVEDMEILSAEELHMPNSYLIILNGVIIGKHSMPQKFTETVRKLRRAGLIDEFVSIFVNKKQRCVEIASNGGRACRPLVIADNGVSRLKECHIKELKDGIRNLESFLREGFIEYLDANETNNALIAFCEDDAKEGTTHIEIEAFTILGVSAGLIPYPQHNLSPSNIYQCAIGKQAVGNIGYNQLCRMDKLNYILVYPQRPLITTRTIELVKFDKLGAGQNAIVAVMSYDGYDTGDAIVMNKSSLDRGFGRCIVTKRIQTEVELPYYFKAPQMEGNEAEKMQALDNDGLASPGVMIQRHDVYINAETSSATASNWKPVRLEYKCQDGEAAVVDKVALFSIDNTKLVIKLMIRQTRRPEVGDRFSSRHALKGVCGNIVQQEDFPFSERGICPDLIMNPHSFPSRRPVGKLKELLGSKAGVSSGRYLYGTAFGEKSGHVDNVSALSETLVKHGFSYSGKDLLYSGITGEPLQAYIFMGPVYYLRLKHMVVDKMNARSSGPKDMMTRQSKAGQRIGERERDCLIAYGASMLLQERLMLSSDPSEIQVCGKCGRIGYYNYRLRIAICPSCRTQEDMSTVKLPHACKLLFQELQAMNIDPRFKLTEDFIKR